MTKSVEHLKEQAYNAWEAKRFEESLDLYTQAIEECSSTDKGLLAELYTQRAQAYLDLADQQVNGRPALAKAERDATRCLSLTPGSAKAHYHCGLAILRTSQPRRAADAVHHFEAALAGAGVSPEIASGAVEGLRTAKELTVQRRCTVAVASTSSAKLEAVAAALEKYAAADVKGYEVASGVSSQPMDDCATLTGARNRLAGLVHDADFCIAIEGGLERRQERLMCFAWVCVKHRDSSFVSESRTGSFALPPTIAKLVLGGMELAHAQDTFFGTVRGKSAQGTVGELTDEKLSRAAFYAQAVELALIPFLNAALYELPQNPLAFEVPQTPKKPHTPQSDVKKQVPAAKVEAPTRSWEELKKEGNTAYLASQLEVAIDLYTQAIKAYEDKFGDNPAAENRKDLAILYHNRSQALLSKCNKLTPQFDPSKVTKEGRALAMKASVDASACIDLDPTYGKGHFRKGQSLLWMSSLQQRAKQAVAFLEEAKQCRNIPQSMMPELEKWLTYAKSRFDSETPMPDMDPSSCKQQ